VIIQSVAKDTGHCIYYQVTFATLCMWRHYRHLPVVPCFRRVAILWCLSIEYLYNICALLWHFGGTCYLRLHETKVIEINQPTKKPTENARANRYFSVRTDVSAHRTDRWAVTCRTEVVLTLTDLSYYLVSFSYYVSNYVNSSCRNSFEVWVCCGWRTPPTAHTNRFQLFHHSGR
jgi:hypothetical protein